MDKIYACEDPFMLVNCLICVGKENCTKYRPGYTNIENESLILKEDE